MNDINSKIEFLLCRQVATEGFFAQFQEVVTLAEIPEKDWIAGIAPFLTGCASDVFHDYVSEEDKKEYKTMKEAFLTASGISPLHSQREFVPPA